MTGQLLRITTALAVVAGGRRRDHLLAARLRTGAVAGESGATARLAPFTVDGLILAASMVMLDASRRSQRVPRLAGWSLAVGIVATVGANLAHGVVHGPIGALVSAWPAVALAGSFELSRPVDEVWRDVALARHAAGGATDVRACGARSW